MHEGWASLSLVPLVAVVRGGQVPFVPPCILALGVQLKSKHFRTRSAFSSHTLQVLTDDGTSVTDQSLLRYARICSAGEYCLNDVRAALRVLSSTSEAKRISVSQEVLMLFPFASVTVHHAWESRTEQTSSKRAP